jgi:hypothetical protein
MAAGNFVPVKQVPKMKKGRVFFFEKKNQKTFANECPTGAAEQLACAA